MPHFFLFFFSFFCVWLSYIFPTLETWIGTDTIDLLITTFPGPEVFLLTVLDRKKEETNAFQSPFVIHFGSIFLFWDSICLHYSSSFLRCHGLLKMHRTESFASGHSYTFKMKYKHYLFQALESKRQ